MLPISTYNPTVCLILDTFVTVLRKLAEIDMFREYMNEIGFV